MTRAALPLDWVHPRACCIHMGFAGDRAGPGSCALGVTAGPVRDGNSLGTMNKWEALGGLRPGCNEYFGGFAA